MSGLGTTSRTMMRALRVTQFGGAEVLKVDASVPIPSPAENQVQVEVKASGLNPVDTYIRAGVYAVKPSLPYTPGSNASGVVSDVGPGVSRFKVLIRVQAAGLNPLDTYIRSGTHEVKPVCPYTPGFDACGTVAAIGQAVQKFKKGDPVYTIKTVTGACAEYAVADQGMVAPLGDRLTFQQGAALGVPYYSAYRALVIKARDKVKPGNSVLIHGASGAVRIMGVDMKGVGIACVQLAVSRGFKVVGTASSQEGREFVMKQGATAVFNHRDDDYADKIVEATGGAGPDIIIEMLANVNLQRDLEMVNRGGIVVVVGSRGPVEINARLCMQKECSVTGMLLFGASNDEWQEMFAEISEGITTGWVQPHICREYSLEEAPTAHDDVINAGSTVGKRIFKI